MKMHPRYRIVTEARLEIGAAITQAVQKHGLTFAEVASILGGELIGWAKYVIREERHPVGPDVPGDAE